MSVRALPMTTELEEYVIRLGASEPEVLRALRVETAKLPDAQMQIGADQGRLMRWLVEAIGAKRCLEIGVFTGYSSTVVALGLPEDGVLVACDIDPNVTRIAERCWKQAGVAHKIQLKLNPALLTLTKLLDDGAEGTFDFAFIDADKERYDEYYEACLRLVRVGGLVLLDNTLWSGKVVDPPADDHDAQAIAELNVKIQRDERVSACLLPIGDGLTLVRKR